MADFFSNLAANARQQEEIFFSALLTLQAFFLQPDDSLVKNLYEDFLQLDLLEPARQLMETFPQVFPDRFERLALLERFAKQMTMLEKFAPSSPVQALSLGTQLAASWKSAKVFDSLSRLSNKLGKKAEGREFLVRAFQRNPFLPRFQEHPEIIPDSTILAAPDIPSVGLYWTILQNIFQSRITTSFELFYRTFADTLDRLDKQPDSFATAQTSLLFLAFRETFAFFLFQTSLTNENTAALISLSRAFMAKIPHALPGHPKFDQLISEIQEGFDKKPDGEKFLFLNLMTLLEFFQGRSLESIRARFLQLVTRIDTTQLLRAMPLNANSIKIFAASFQAIFQNLDDALHHYCEFMKDFELSERRNLEFKIALRWLFVITNVYGYETNFLQFYPTFRELFYRAIKLDLPEIVFSLHFPLSHIYLNLTQTQDEWKIFNQEIEEPLSRYIQNKIVPKFDIRANPRRFDATRRPLKIAFVFDRIVQHAPFKVLYSLLKSLRENDQNNEFELRVYDLEYLDKSISEPEAIKMLQDLGVNYIPCHAFIGQNHLGPYYSRLQKSLAIRRELAQDKIDVLVMCNSREIFNFLFTTRTAPLQVFWTHGMHVYDCPGIDSRIIHATVPLEPLQLSGFTYHPILVGNDAQFYTPPVDQTKVSALRRRFPQETILLGTIGRLIKLDSPAYLEAVIQILRRCPQCIYLACGAGGAQSIRQVIAAAGLSDRFLFEGHVDSHIYGHLLDLYLNSFPLRSGEAFTEFQAKGKPTISMLQNPLHNPEIRQEYRPVYQKVQARFPLPEENHAISYAATTEEYIRKAVELITSPALRRDIGTFNRYLWEEMVQNSQRHSFSSFRTFCSSHMSKKS
jgi:hypothetical protein